MRRLYIAMYVIASLLAGIAPAKAQFQGPIYCGSVGDAAAGFTTKTQVVPAPSGSARTFVCGYTVSAVAASVITFQYGTGSNCATNSTAVGPTIQLAATSTFGDTSPTFRGFSIPAGQSLCATATTAANLEVYYAQQ